MFYFFLALMAAASHAFFLHGYSEQQEIAPNFYQT
jgi:hypothetical protein